MQLRISPGGSMPNSFRSAPELPPSSVTVTIAPRRAIDHGPSASTYAFSPRSSVERPVPPPMATMLRPWWRIRGGLYALSCVVKRLCPVGEAGVRTVAHGLQPIDLTSESSVLAAGTLASRRLARLRPRCRMGSLHGCLVTSEIRGFCHVGSETQPSQPARTPAFRRCSRASRYVEDPRLKPRLETVGYGSCAGFADGR